MKSSLKKSLYTTLGIVLLLIGWVVISSLIKNSDMIFPSPLKTFEETILLLKKSYTYACIWESVLRTIIGFSISFVLAFVLGTLGGNIPNIKHVISPLMSVLKSIPTASIVFLFLVLVGAKNSPIVMVGIISLPIQYEAVLRGFENIGKELKDAARIDGAPLITRIVKVYIPNITPYVLVGIVSSFSLSFKIEIMSEVISGTTSKGLGSIIAACQKSDPTNMVPIFAYSLITIVIVSLLSLILYILEKRFTVGKNN